MERKFWVKISRNITSRGCPLFRKLWKLYSSLEISGTSKQAAFHSTIFEKFRFAFHGNSSSEWNSSSSPGTLFLSSRFLSSTVLASSVTGFQFLDSQCSVPATFAEVLPCTFLHSRFSAVSKVGEVLVEWKARTVSSQWAALL